MMNRSTIYNKLKTAGFEHSAEYIKAVIDQNNDLADKIEKKCSSDDWESIAISFCLTHSIDKVEIWTEIWELYRKNAAVFKNTLLDRLVYYQTKYKICKSKEDLLYLINYFNGQNSTPKNPPNNKELLRLLTVLDMINENMINPDISKEITWTKEGVIELIKTAFEQEKLLDLEEAIAKICEESKFGNNCKITVGELIAKHKQFDCCYREIKSKYTSMDAISKEIASNEASDELKVLALAVHALNTYTKKTLTTAQQLALLLAMDARGKPQARILQMKTGEGKTLVVAALAVYEVLMGRKEEKKTGEKKRVDIITSSSELAENQWMDMKSFYEKVGISVEHNAVGRAMHIFCNEKDDKRALNDRLKYWVAKGKKAYESKNEVYKCDIVYGSAADFMTDILSDNFDETYLRWDREYSVAIVDEVDSMFLDGRKDSARLSSPSFGMEYLIGTLSYIWKEVNSNLEMSSQKHGVWYYKNGDENIELQGLKALHSYCQKRLHPKMKMILKSLTSPTYLKSLIRVQLPKWIESAVNARFILKKDFDYVIHEDNKLVIVDWANTGVHHPQMQYDDGLQQFLQMKHGIEVDAESLPTNFITNVTFFLKYGANVIGLTGTIGGESSRLFLKNVYKVDFVFIPPSKNRRHKNLSSYILDGDDAWKKKIVESAVKKLRGGRAVLIITEYISHAECLEKSLSQYINEKTKKRVKTYTGYKNESIFTEKIQSGHCIVATNIAGRGTDILVSDEALEMGGLHVILTVLPNNDRVQEQSIGRSSRNGQPGTSQLIINKEHVNEQVWTRMIKRAGPEASTAASYFLIVRPKKNLHFRDRIRILEKERDDLAQGIASTDIAKLEEMKQRDDALQMFVEYRQKNLGEEKNLGDNEKKSKLERIRFRSLNAEFGRYLAETEIITAETVQRKFQEQGDSHTNPASAVLFMNTLKESNSENIEKSFSLLEEAIALDPYYSISAYYYQAFLFLGRYTKEDQSWLAKAIDSFKKCKKCLIRQQKQYQALKENVEHVIGRNKPKILLQQIHRKMFIIDLILSNIKIFLEEDSNGDEGGTKKVKTFNTTFYKRKEWKKALPHGKSYTEYKDDITIFKQEGLSFLYEPIGSWEFLLDPIIQFVGVLIEIANHVKEEIFNPVCSLLAGADQWVSGTINHVKKKVSNTIYHIAKYSVLALIVICVCVCVLVICICKATGLL